MIDVAHLGRNGSPEECSLADVLVKIHINPSLAGSQGLGHPYKACSGVSKRRENFFFQVRTERLICGDAQGRIGSG